MIAIDTSSFIAYFSGEKGADIEAVDFAFQQKQTVLPPVVLCEILSDPDLPPEFRTTVLDIPLLPLSEGFWERAGLLRSKLLAKKLKARLADSLIAQVCMDHTVALITRDKDFRHFEKLGLHLFE